MPAATINLVSKGTFDKSLPGKLLRWALTYGRYIIICTEIIVLLAFIYRFSLDRKITDLNDEISQKSAIISANVQFEQQFRHLQNRIVEIGTLVSNQDLSLLVLHHLEQITPPGVVFTSLSLSKDGVAIDGSANTNTQLALFLQTLKSSQLLSQIDVTSLNKKSEGTGDITFHIEAVMQPAQ